MIARVIRPEEKDKYNSVVTHPLQSWEWGEFRQKTGVKVIRVGLFEQEKMVSGYQVTFHPVPKTSYTIGYLPKCVSPEETMIYSLKKIGQENNCIFIKLEPNVGGFYPLNQQQQDIQQNLKEYLKESDCIPGRPLFTKYTFSIDLTRSEADILTAMKPKTRYNLRLSQKYGVEIVDDETEKGFEEYLKLTFQTAKRQKFYAHSPDYHRKMWESLAPAGMAHLLKAVYQGKTLVTWVLFTFKNILYYPYGASTLEHKEVMASTMMMWSAMMFGKSQGCRVFDLWGSLGPQPDPKDPWYGFHHFKEGFSPQLVEFVGSFDLVIDPTIYKLYNLADDLRWKWLKFKAVLPF